MSSNKKTLSEVATPKGTRKAGQNIKTPVSNPQLQQIKSTPLNKTVGNVPATPGTRRKHNKRRRAKKNKGEEVDVEGAKTEETAVAVVKKTKKTERSSKGVDEDVAVVSRSNWKLSPSLGGRFLQLDPVFARNEKYILLAHSMSLKIYSTKTSLLVRTILLPASTKPSEKITTYHIDPENENNTYIATSAGRLFLWDWVDGKLVHEWNLSVSSLEFISVSVGERPESEEFVGIVYAAECAPKSGTLWRIRLPKNPEAAIEKTSVYETTIDRISAAQVLDGGNIVVATAGRTLVVGNKAAEQQEGKSKWGVFRKYPMTFNLACMDSFLPAIELAEGKGKKGKKAKSAIGDMLGDVVIGDETGAMHVFHNILRQKETSNSEPVIRKLHWHRKKVHSVKWALDGNYIISGGSETVLVLWQIETGHKQFLPHLGSPIIHLTVSPRASSYAVLLADNSTMILSTTELKPKANIAGIQAHTTPSDSKHHSRIPCVLHPTTANRLLLATPSSQSEKDVASPYLQTFDTYSDRHVARQALTRTTATTFNSGPDQGLLVEPDIAYIAITPDGNWLATIDTWRPPKHHSSLLITQEDEGREIYLKFWSWSAKKKIWELVTRVDSPHPSSSGLGAEEVFDLVAAPQGHGFATVGADGSVRVWRAKVRTRAGGALVRGAEGAGLTSWGCRRVIMFSKGKREIELSTLTLLDVAPKKSSNPYWGCVAFSEDGSVVAIATPVPGLGAKEDSTVHLADSDAAVVRQSVGGLQVGRTHGVGIFERYLIILGSSKLLVWNLVNSSVQWEFSLEVLGASSNVTSGHLAVDHHSQTFAVTFPPLRFTDSHKVFIFSATTATPVHVQEIGLVPVTALKSSEGGKGYMILDAEAKIQYISPILAPHVSVAHQASGGEFSLQDDDEEEAAGGGLSSVYLTNGSEEEVEPVCEDMDEDDDGVVDRVVPREALESIFDAVPSYAAGSVEEAFEKVLGLFAKKPLSVDDNDQGASEDDGEDEEDEDEDGDMQMITM